MPQLPDLSTVLPPDSGYDAAGELVVGGCRITDLVAQHGSPLYVYDEACLRDNLDSCRTGVEAYAGPGARVVYATKAFASVAMLELVAEAGLGADVASEGELAIAVAAGLDPDSLVLHGNAKPRQHLADAVAQGVGLIVIDSPHELAVLEEVAAAAGIQQEILVRVTPGIDADTHEFIRTGHDESKFGVSMDEGEALLRRAQDSPHLHARGIHLHVGSQLVDDDTWAEAVDWAADYLARLRAAGLVIDTVDFGGGLGIAYLPDDAPRRLEDWLRIVCSAVEARFASAGLDLPYLIFEPGRAVVGRAGVTAYSVVTTKRAGERLVAAVDGGMSDNPRPMLYGATYSCLPAVCPPDGAPVASWTIAGMHCESGDLVIEETPLTEPSPGDVLVVPATGAYGHSMASNYNAVLRPAVVFCADGSARRVVRRETIADLLGREV